MMATTLRRLIALNTTSTRWMVHNGNLLICRCIANRNKESTIKVAVIGDPNAGKSTLVNTILGRRINSVSTKVHTTRRKTLAVLNVEKTQIVFVDTPGFVSARSRAKHKLEKSLHMDAYTSVEDVDVVVAVHDASNFYTKHVLSTEIQQALRLVPPSTSTVLALNKVDAVSNKSELLTLTRKLVKPPEERRGRKWSLHDLFDDQDIRRQAASGSSVDAAGHANRELPETPSLPSFRFDAVFMVSALSGVGVQPMKDYLLAKARPSPWLYDGGFTTDQSLEEMVTLCVKEKMLDLLDEEMPYRIIPQVEVIHEDEAGQMNIVIKMLCENRRLASALMGPSGSTIRNVALSAELSLAEAFNKPVVLKLVLKQSRGSAKAN